MTDSNVRCPKCPLMIVDDGSEWNHWGRSGEYYLFKSKDDKITVCAEHLGDNRYAIFSVWT